MSNEVRVRFAPSPTGHLHIGGARTALYNWLFARSNKGKFILRVEDTDLTRSSQESMNEIIDSLGWLGVQWDEGPGVEGSFGPYTQSQRTDIYEKYLNILMERGHAYYCYCTHEELAAQRENAAKGKPPMYSKRCRYLTDEQKSELSLANPNPILRFAVPEEARTLVVKDLIYESVSFDSGTIGDFVIKKRDGMPTYNFAASIDDFEMNITHVIRGVDHLSNTPKQVLVYQAIGKEIPQFAHLPLLVGNDKQPLSKRHGAVSLVEFRKEGYLSRAIINYLALLGWSYDDKTTIFSVDDLIEKFTLEKVSKSSAMFDVSKLDWMNGLYIREMSLDDLVEEITEYLKHMGIYDNYSWERVTLKQATEIVQEKIKRLDEFQEITDFLFFDRAFTDAAVERLLKVDPEGNLLKSSIETLGGLESFKREDIESTLRSMSENLAVKPSNVFQAIRIGISGKMITPGIFESLELLGKEMSIARLEETIKKFY